MLKAFKHFFNNRDNTRYVPTSSSSKIKILELDTGRALPRIIVVEEMVEGFQHFNKVQEWW